MKLFIKVIIFSVLSTASVFLLSFSASAQSPDSATQYPFYTSDGVYFQTSGSKPVDHTYDWVNFFWNNFKEKFPSAYDKYRSSFDKAVTDGAIGVVQNDVDNKYRYFSFFWSEARDCDFFVNRINKAYYMNSSSKPNCEFTTMTMDSTVGAHGGRKTSSFVISDQPNQNVYYKIFMFTGDYKLDSSIQDLDINIRKSLDSGKSIVSPEFEYKIEDKKITVKHLKDKDNIKMSAFSNYTKDGWRLKNDTYQISFVIQRKHSGDLVGSEQIINPGGNFSVDVDDYGEYSIVASYKSQACYSYGNSSPDYCINVYPDDTEDFDYRSKTMYVYVDGKNHQGSTLSSKCLHGFCQAQPEYEDCSKHDLLLRTWSGGPEFKIPSILSIGCTINNAFKWVINEVILPLIMPSQDFLRDKFGELQNNLSKSFGFLWTPVTLIQTFYNGVINNQISGDTCALPPMSMFGSTATIHLCSWRYQLPDLWRYMQLAVQGGLVVGLIWSLYSLAMRFFGVHVQDDDDDDDGFEEVRWRDDRTGDVGEWQRRSKK